MSDSVNDELEQLLDEWIESIMQEVRKAREARLAEIRQELNAISARLDALEQEFEERRRARAAASTSPRGRPVNTRTGPGHGRQQCRANMTQEPPMPTTSDQMFYATIIEQNKEIIALLKRIAPTDEQTPADDGSVKLTGL